jgi:hypothetical protein
MLIDFSKLISWSYLTNRFPAPLSNSFYWAWLIGCGLAIVLAIGLRIWIARSKDMAPAWHKLYGRLASVFSTTGIVMLILFWFRTERLPFLSMRAFVLGWLIAVLVWLGYILYTAIRKVPDEVKIWEDKQRIAKYLPH